MFITTQSITELKRVFGEHQKWTGILSDQVKTAQDRYGENLISLERDGKKINVKEKELWKELYYGGYTAQAWGILSEKYPEVAKAHEEEVKVAKQVREFTVRNFGFVFSEMSLVNLIDLISSIRRYELMKFFFIDTIIITFKKIKYAIRRNREEK